MDLLAKSDTRIALSDFLCLDMLLLQVLGCKRIAIVLSHFVRHHPETSTPEARVHLKKINVSKKSLEKKDSKSTDVTEVLVLTITVFTR